MSVMRISKESLDDILTGRVNEDATCVVKFYSNTCHMCQSLHDYYESISENTKYGDVHFLAFNIDDDPVVEKNLNFKGVPTIFVVHTHIGNRPATLRMLPDPENPNDSTWYTVNEIKSFLDKETL